MGAAIPPTIRSRIVRLLFLRITPQSIATECNCSVSTVYHIQENIFIYGSSFRPCFRMRGGPHKIKKAAGESLIKYLEEQQWAQQKEMVQYLWEEWDLDIHRSTVGRFLKRMRWSAKRGRRVGDRQNTELRLAWIAGLLNITAEQIVAGDKSNFNEATGWRRQVYAPIGQPGRLHDAEAQLGTLGPLRSQRSTPSERAMKASLVGSENRCKVRRNCKQKDLHIRNNQSLHHGLGHVAQYVRPSQSQLTNE